MSKSETLPVWARQLVRGKTVNPHGLSGFAQERMDVIQDITPLFLFRVGAYGAAQPELMEGLAKSLNARFISGAVIKAKIMGRASVYSNRKSRYVREAFGEAVMAALNDGHDVVGDLALNTPHTREVLLKDIHAEGFEPVVVAVNTEARIKTVEQRVREMAVSGLIDGIRPECFETPPVRVALDTLQQLGRGESMAYASPKEPMIDYVVDVDGNDPTIFAIQQALRQLPADIDA